MNAIQTEHLTKYYGKARGILDVSLSVESGDFFGFIGPNGAGKSTTIRTLLGLISPTQGSANVLEMDVQTQKKAILEKVGYLPSETTFYGGMRVSELIAFSARMRGMDCKQEAAHLCDCLDLDPERRIRDLSLGNRKKVGIVCAMQHKPSLYILDEPTSGLDPLVQKSFYELLIQRNEQGATVFLSSHVLSEISKYCRHAAIIRDGKLLACDRMEALNRTGIKHVTLRGITSLPHIPQAQGITAEDDTVRFLYEGDIKTLLAALNTLTFTDLTLTDPDPEDVFLHYYQKEER